MKTSIEISMYPLNENYGTAILKFIKKLKTYAELEIHTNTMSSQIFGDYDDMMGILTKEMKQTFEEGTDTIMVFKIANLDLKP